MAVPAFELKYLRKGHAVHFRCHDREAEGLQVDVIAPPDSACAIDLKAISLAYLRLAE